MMVAITVLPSQVEVALWNPRSISALFLADRAALVDGFWVDNKGDRRSPAVAAHHKDASNSCNTVMLAPPTVL
jgi:hypothetical protein